MRNGLVVLVKDENGLPVCTGLPMEFIDSFASRRDFAVSSVGSVKIAKGYRKLADLTKNEAQLVE